MKLLILNHNNHSKYLLCTYSVPGSRVLWTLEIGCWVQVPTLAPVSCETLVTYLNDSVPQLSHLQDGNSNIPIALV